MPPTPDHRPLHYVIGSGPAGTACAYALLEQGAKVVMLDAGIKLEEPRRKTLAQMASVPPKRWTAQQLEMLKSGMSAGVKGIPLKLAYGSDYPYRETNEHLPADYERVALAPTLAQGGFSSVWGAAMMPYSGRDMAGWPIGSADLAKHYDAVAKITGLSGIHDDLEPIFPLHGASPEALNMSRQAKIFYARLENHRAQLQKAGIFFGQSRLGVKGGKDGCVYCGMCMYGCPYGFIYNSEQTLKTFRQNPAFHYQPDSIVTRLKEDGDQVRIIGYQRVTRKPFEFSAQRAFLATGPVSTAKTVLGSLGIYDQPVFLKDSQYYLFPLVTRTGMDVRAESMHTLSQMFMEIFDGKITPHSVHLQIYSYNELVGEAVRQPFGPAGPLMEWLAGALEKRLLVVQGYLHSDDSSRIAVRLKKGEPDRLQLAAELNPRVPGTIKRVMRKLQRHARRLDAFPLSPMLQIADPGRGFHSGGSFPMRKNPGNLETDTLGRLPAWKRIHIVDASVLPDIPATQITFSVMANAHRIASASAEK